MSAIAREGDSLETKPKHRELAKVVAQIFALALGYLVLGWIGQRLAPPPGFASLIWPASGLAIVGLMAFGYRVTPGVFLGALLTNALAVSAVLFHLNGIVLLNATVIAAGSSLQAAIATYWIKRRVSYPLKLGGSKDALRLLLVIPVACLVGASVGTATLYATGVLSQDNLSAFWLRWWLGDMGGILIVVPLLLLAPWSRGKIWWRGEPLSPFPAVSFIAILILLCATLAAWRINMQTAYERSLASFDSLATDSQQALSHRMQSYRRTLDGGAALFEATENVTLAEWQTYTSVLNLPETLPGISGIGFIERVSAEDLQQFRQSVRDRGIDNFSIHPLTGRDEMFVIVFIEPLADNIEAVGLDIAFEDNRRRAARRARDTGRATITERILLVQDETESPGFLLLRPVYDVGSPTDTVEQRRAALQGWIYAPFMAPRFMNGLTASQGRLFDIAVYDGTGPNPESMIYSSSQTGRPAGASAFSVERTFEVMEQPWTVVWTSTPAFERGVRTSEASLVLGGGMLLTIIFAALLLAGSRREAYVSRQVEQRTRELEETVAALADSERRFGDLAGLSPAGIFRTDPFGFCSYVNEAWIRATGLSPSEALGAGWLEAVHPNARPHVRQQWLTAIGESKPMRMEVQFVAGGGPARWVDLIAAPRWDECGETQGFIGVAIDITEQKRAMDALKESEQRFQSLASLSPAGIFRTTDEGVCNYVNAAWCRMAGLAEDEALGMGWKQAVHPDDLEGLVEGWSSAVQAGAPYRGEFRWLHRDGSITWVDAVAQPELEEDGALQGYIGVVLDITYRKRVEKELADRDEQLTLLAQNATDAVFRIDLDGCCIYASPSTSEVLGIPAEDLAGKPAFDHIHPDDEARVKAHFEDLRSDRTDKIVIAYRSGVPGKPDNYRWLEAHAALVRERETNRPKEISASIRDISDRKRMELDLIAARRHAEAAAAAKATFLANMSHEIRTPMNGVVGFTEMLLDGDLAPQQREKAQLIADSGRAMMQILNDILDISKIDAGQMKIVRESIDLRHKMNSCMRLLEPTARQKGLKFDLVVDDDVPSQVMADPLRLRQILTNLVGNAIKFTSTGSVRTRVSVEHLPGRRDMLNIAVEDSGIGIPAHRLEAIFREFSQADESTARVFGGTGLGLTISSELAKLMDGELLVSSDEGQGSVFTLRIPLLSTEGGEHEAEVQQPSEQALDFSRPPRILVAEDHDINQALMLSMASRLGLAITIAGNGEEAVRMVHEGKSRGEPYDLVLMDVQMPVMDGLEATQALRQDGISADELPILAQTANAYREDVERCHAAGMQGHLAKPIRLRDLRDAMQHWLPSQLSEKQGAQPAEASAPTDAEGKLKQRYLDRRQSTLDALRRLDADHPPGGEEVEAVARLLHKLAGSAGMFGEEELGRIAGEQEKALLAADPEQVGEAIRTAQETLFDCV